MPYLSLRGRLNTLHATAVRRRSPALLYSNVCALGTYRMGQCLLALCASGPNSCVLINWLQRFSWRSSVSSAQPDSRVRSTDRILTVSECVPLGGSTVGTVADVISVAERSSAVVGCATECSTPMRSKRDSAQQNCNGMQRSSSRDSVSL